VLLKLQHFIIKRKELTDYGPESENDGFRKVSSARKEFKAGILFLSVGTKLIEVLLPF
jgi:hypothetical protein